jgi:hypothetical protein
MEGEETGSAATTTTHSVARDYDESLAVII